MEVTPWEKLHGIDVKPNLVKKQNLDYLPWPVVYDVFNKLFGNDWDVEEIDDPNTGYNYFTDGKSAWVKVRITIGDKSRMCSLPVMDNRNKSIMDGLWTSFDINDALQRCKVKCAAYWGLGTDVFTNLDKIEILTKEEADRQREERAKEIKRKEEEKLKSAKSEMEKAQTVAEFNGIVNSYRELWNNEEFQSIGKKEKQRISNLSL